MSRKSRVRIVYKSGAIVDVRCSAFTVTKQGGTITNVEWEGCTPAPLHLGVDDIAAVFEL